MKQPNIQIKYKLNQYKERDYHVTMDGKEIKPDNTLDGMRTKYIVNGMIIKVDNEPSHAPKELRIYKNILQADKKYFPKLLGGSARQGYVIQKYLKLQSPNSANKNTKNIVSRLVNQYHISDLHVGKWNWNWALCAVTGNPILFDFGMKY